jgi:hypothetical protein
MRDGITIVSPVNGNDVAKGGHRRNAATRIREGLEGQRNLELES